MMDGMDGMMGGGALVMLGLIALVVLVVAAVGAAWMVKEFASRTSVHPALRDPPDAKHQTKRPSALEQAQEQYVRGEIDHAEFERRLDNLVKTGQLPTDDS